MQGQTDSPGENNRFQGNNESLCLPVGFTALEKFVFVFSLR